MLARVHRLRAAADFNKTYKFGRSTNAETFYIKVFQTHYETSRVAVVASKKVSKRAVVRNRCKRRVVEIVRKDWSSINPGYNIIFTIKSDISKLSSPELERAVQDCLNRAGLKAETKPRA